jgi:CPA2 family monovalent cation:H+ antiporter-2
MELEFLKALVLVFGVTALSVFLLQRIMIPPIVGFIFAGILIGPYGFGLIEDMHEIEILAEIGVILLLFTVGIEFSLKHLLRMRKTILLSGGGQVLLTIGVCTALVYPLIKDLNTCVFIGFLVALSSTAIVLKMLLERGETDAPQGRMMAGILIFQDLCVVPFMLLVPALSGEGLDTVELTATLLKTAAIIAVVFLGTRKLIPGLLHHVVRTRSRELFIITVIVLCLGIALITSEFGLSLALGAFLAGLIISESEYSYQVMADILPFKDSFMGLFFVSIGMLMDTGYLLSNWQWILTIVMSLFLIKTLTASASILFTSASPRVAIHAGLGIAQVGEFSFILAEAGKQAGLITGDIFQLFLSSSVVTMGLTPFLLSAAPGVSGWLTSRKALSRLIKFQKEEEGPPGKLSGHVIIVGFGLNGKNLARTLRETGISYVVLELNSDTVREERKHGEPIYFGDGTSREVLMKLGVDRARLFVVVISDPSAARKMVSIAKKENPPIHVIVRTRYIAELDDLKAMGADEVIPEEFETSIEIFSRVLNHYHIPRNVIGHHVVNIRKNSYKVFRTHELPEKPLTEIEDLLSNIETDTYLVKKHSPLAGRSLDEMKLRTRTGATLIAVRRGQEIFQNPSPSFVIRENDTVLLVGMREDINRAIEFIEGATMPREQ